MSKGVHLRIKEEQWKDERTVQDSSSEEKERRTKIAILGNTEKVEKIVPNLSAFRYLLILGKESDHERKKKIFRNKLCKAHKFWVHLKAAQEYSEAGELRITCG